jgi:hypothetical protein
VARGARWCTDRWGARPKSREDEPTRIHQTLELGAIDGARLGLPLIAPSSMGRFAAQLL